MVTDAEDVDSSGMQRKLEAYNHVLDQEMATLRDVTGGAGNNKRRQQQFLNHCTHISFFVAPILEELKVVPPYLVPQLN